MRACRGPAPALLTSSAAPYTHSWPRPRSPTGDPPMRRLLCLPPLFAALALLFAAEDKAPPLLFEDDFGKGADRWEPSGPKAWKVIDAKGGKAYSLFNKKSEFTPPHRSPLHYALVKDLSVGDFVLDVRCKSTIADYPHRDLCFFFGYQDK